MTRQNLFGRELKVDLEGWSKDSLSSTSHSFVEADVKVATPGRMRYQAQVDVIKKQIGDIETVRANLGLSRRKMAQLLLVDPSAWTRWVRDGNTPAHVYRALQWYMAVSEKIPALGSNYWFGTVTTQAKEVASEKKLIEIEKLILKEQRKVKYLTIAVISLVIVLVFEKFVK